MAKKNDHTDTQAKATTLAKGIKKNGQSKEQTKLIAAGIEKGIALYKKQHKAKMREQDKARNKKKKQPQLTDEPEAQVIEQSSQRTWLPWGLLAVSWLGFGGYILGGLS